MISQTKLQELVASRKLTGPSIDATRGELQYKWGLLVVHWYNTLADLLALRAECTEWHEALPDSLRDTDAAEVLQAIVDFDLGDFISIRPEPLHHFLSKEWFGEWFGGEL